MTTHEPVLLHEVRDRLNIVPDGNYVDATFGRGGHARAVLEQLTPDGRLLVLDQDPEAVASARAELESDPRVTVVHGSFADLDRHLDRSGHGDGVNGILFDLGVSSPQLDRPERGFSFSHDGPLDMRMDTTKGVTAAEWLANAGEREIAEVIKTYGEDRSAKRIARAIVEERGNGPIATTAQLADIVARASLVRHSKRHPATRAFQAIRIFLNRELDDLPVGLRHALNALMPRGRLCVISFHSLEDRIVKRFMRQHARPDPVYAGLPEIPPEARPQLVLVGKAVMPTPKECERNPRARSAVLRVAEKTTP